MNVCDGKVLFRKFLMKPYKIQDFNSFNSHAITMVSGS